MNAEPEKEGPTILNMSVVGKAADLPQIRANYSSKTLPHYHHISIEKHFFIVKIKSKRNNELVFSVLPLSFSDFFFHFKQN